ncbi:MAG: bifunctional precorrin-2 dehydrogenase/sirohydrochlorin ferrochelatase [Ilumatobacteraceae bacterium]|jgi:siroheme synthase-like protein|nr:bifunctional precorrin-2 dehydrogenase/sirohydrochlorin ferrochelatase [Ilumatobacteraceae bacterium]
MDFGYPVVLDLRGVLVLVVGAGPVGVRKVEGLVAAGAAVRVVATRVTGPLDRSTVVEVRERAFDPVDLDGVRLVVTATGDAAVDAEVAGAARERGLWVNAADQAEDCGFILPAVARAGTLTIAVSTDGASPALARRLRDHCAALLTPAVVELAEALRAERRAVQAAGGSTEAIDWSPRIDPVLPPAEPLS